MHQLQRDLLKIIEKQNIGDKTLRMIGELVGEAHPQSVKFHLSQLEKKGLIQIDKLNGVIRKSPAGPVSGSSFYSVPIIGSASCGEATRIAEENVEGYLKVSKSLLKKTEGIFCLRAVGNSMNKAEIDGKKIEDGDFVVIDSNDRRPRSGDYILSVIEGMANIKEYRKDINNNCIVLLANSTQDHDPIYIHEEDDSQYYVGGKVVQVIKKPKYA